MKLCPKVLLFSFLCGLEGDMAWPVKDGWFIPVTLATDLLIRSLNRKHMQLCVLDHS